MKKSVYIMMIVCTCLFNVLTITLFDYLMKEETMIYMIQTGRYQNKDNASTQIEKLNTLGYKGYSYINKDIIVYSGIYQNQNKANDLALDISHHGMTCVVKGYSVPVSYIKDIENKNYKKVCDYIRRRSKNDELSKE